MRNDVKAVYILGSGNVQIVASDTPGNFFKSAPAQSGGGVNVKWDLDLNNDPYDFIANTKNTTGYCGSGYNFTEAITNKFGLYQSFSGYNLTHSNTVDFTNVKKIIVTGATKSNLDGLTATSYCRISDESLSELADDWAVMNHSVCKDVSEFSAEIDCSAITGENFIYFAVLHGTESTANSSYLFIYDIEFIYG